MQLTIIYITRYTTIVGIKNFVDLALQFSYGKNSTPLLENRVAATQSISGTGALRLMAEFLSKFSAKKEILIPEPTWANHAAIFKNGGLIPKHYRYYDREKRCIDFEGLMSDLQNVENGSLVVLHGCAQNPTGCDPSHDQWNALSKLIKTKKHVVLFDLAYQGFASGDPETDAYAIRKFVEDGHQILMCQSFAKNFGLYGERIGTFSIVTESPEEVQLRVGEYNNG